MTTTIRHPLSHRDRAILRAVARGRCRLSGEIGAPLLVDGVYCCDQLVGLRLAAAGLIRGDQETPTITETGRAVLAAA